MTVHSTSIVSDILIDIRDFLHNNVSDPNASRNGTTWVLTSFPQKQVQYPTIIVEHMGSRDEWGAIGSENRINYTRLNIEIWSDSVKERNTVWADIYDEIRTHFLDTLTTLEISDFQLLNVYNADQPEINLHRKVGQFQFQTYSSD